MTRKTLMRILFWGSVLLMVIALAQLGVFA